MLEVFSNFNDSVILLQVYMNIYFASHVRNLKLTLCENDLHWKGPLEIKTGLISTQNYLTYILVQDVGVLCWKHDILQRNMSIFKRPHKDQEPLFCSRSHIWVMGIKTSKNFLFSKYRLPLLLNVDLKVINYGNKLSITLNKIIRSFGLKFFTVASVIAHHHRFCVEVSLVIWEDKLCI